MCTFYHASNLSFVAGKPYSINDFDGEYTYDHKNRPVCQQLINMQLDKERPDGVLSRMNCIYLFCSLTHCLAYARSHHIAHIYEVRADDNIFGPYPMTLVTTIFNCPAEIRHDVIREYWHHTYNWKIFEFLTDSIIVEREIPIESRGYNRDDFIDDRLLSRKIYYC